MNKIVSTKYYYGEPSMKDQICGVCGTYRREYKFLVGKLKERDYLEYVCIDAIIILKWNLSTWDRKALTGLIWLRMQTSGVFFRTQ